MIDKDVLKQYGIFQDNILSIKPADKVGNTAIKIWFIKQKDTSKIFVLKMVKLKHKQFPIELQHLLHHNGFGTPSVYRTEKGELYISSKKGYYFLSEYVEPNEKLSTKQRTKALADFHRIARFRELKVIKEKIQFPNFQQFNRVYNNKLIDLKKWHSSVKKDERKAYLGEMINQAETSLGILKTCNVEEYIKAMTARNSICHGDYNARNSYLNSEGETMVIDFDRAYFGLPIDDFRFLVHSLASRSDHVQKLDFLFDEYFSHSPEDKKFKPLYLADTIFPHQFHKQMTRNLKGKAIKNLKKINTEEFMNWIEVERRKKSYVMEKLYL
ncbi:phosphotransferase [Salipaludibacillus keqinensis]|nr:phosphotransferase [Salipaludibacillus keqinensis]